MVVINWHLYIYFFFIIILSYKSNTVYSIQCCSDITCLEEFIDCPSNVCFKLVFTKINEQRGCMNDLIRLLKPSNTDGKNLNDVYGASNDDCQDVSGTSLCKCTSNLCNSASKYSHFSFPVWIFILFVVYQFPCVFL